MQSHPQIVDLTHSLMKGCQRISAESPRDKGNGEIIRLTQEVFEHFDSLLQVALVSERTYTTQGLCMIESHRLQYYTEQVTGNFY